MGETTREVDARVLAALERGEAVDERDITLCSTLVFEAVRERGRAEGKLAQETLKLSQIGKGDTCAES